MFAYFQAARFSIYLSIYLFILIVSYLILSQVSSLGVSSPAGMVDARPGGGWSTIMVDARPAPAMVDAAAELFVKLVRKLAVCEEEDRTERRAFVSRHAAQAGTTVAATLAQLQQAGVLSQEQVCERQKIAPPACHCCTAVLTTAHHCAGGGVGWLRSGAGGSGGGDSARAGRDASH